MFLTYVYDFTLPITKSDILYQNKFNTNSHTHIYKYMLVMTTFTFLCFHKQICAEIFFHYII